MRVLFAGSPDIAVPALLAIGRSFELVAVLTNPPAPRGRSHTPQPTAVAAAAARHFPTVPVLAPERLGPAERQAIAAIAPDILAVYAYGRIFGPKFLALFPHGAINAHPSLLPRWRGPAPIPYAIMARDAGTGLSVQRIAIRLDSGDILARQRLTLDGHETTATLSEWAAGTGAALMQDVLRRIAAGTLPPGEPQDEAQATWSSQISKDDGLVDWKIPALELDARIRAFTPWPGAWTHLNGERLGILEARPYPDAVAAIQADQPDQTDQPDQAIQTDQPDQSDSPGHIGQLDASNHQNQPIQPGQVLNVDKSRGIMVQTGAGLLAITVLQSHGRKPLGFKDFINGARGLVGSHLG
jgi:methionyl-tRNA formyltransferase